MRRYQRFCCLQLLNFDDHLTEHLWGFGLCQTKRAEVTFDSVKVQLPLFYYFQMSYLVQTKMCNTGKKILSFNKLKPARFSYFMMKIVADKFPFY